MKSKTVKIILAILLVGIISFLVVSCTKKEGIKVSLISNGETIEDGSYADEFVTLSFESEKEIKKVVIIDKTTNEKKEYDPQLINGKYVVKVKVEESSTLEYYTIDEKGKESAKQEINIKIDREKPSFDMNEEKEIFTLNSYDEKKDLIINLTNIKDDSAYKTYYKLDDRNYQEIDAKENFDLKLTLNSGIHNIKVKVVDESGKETIKTKLVEVNYFINIKDNNTTKQFKVINGERISYYENLPTNNNKLFKGYSVDNENIIDNNYIVNNLKELVALYDEETVVPKEEPKPQKPVNPPVPSAKVNKPTCNNSTYSGNETNLLNGNGNYTAENNKQTIPGTYTITASVIEGYTWNDDSTESIILNCELKKNEITVTSESKTKVYDGEELTASAIVTKGNIYNNKIVYDSTSSIINVGTTTNKGTVKILNNNNDDVTNYFIINQVDGTLEVTKNYISVTTGSSTKLYDKTPLTNSVITLTKGTLGKNHTLSFDSQTTITTPGSIENTGVVKVLDKNSNDVTSNYSINPTYGTLTVTGEYTVTYSYNKDNYSDVSISVTTKNIYHGEDAIEIAPTATKTGWNFVGWTKDKNATSKLTESIVTSNTTLYAIFTRNLSPQYILINDNGSLQGASLSQPYQSFKENEVKTFTILDKNMTEASLNNLLTQFDVSDYNGFSYYGFTEKPDLSMDKVYFKGDEITGNDVINLYELRRKQVTVTYNTDGGSTVASSTGYAYIDINKNVKNYEISSLPTTTKEGYTFGGWYKEAGLTNKVTTVTTDANMTLYAKWTKNTVKVTYGYNSDNYSNVTISESSKNIGYNEDAITNAPTASKEGWTFVGWNTDKNATTALSELKVTEAKTLYAIFKKDVTPLYAMTASDNVKLSTTVYIYKESGTVKVNVAALNTDYDSNYTGYTTYTYSGKSDLSMDNLYNPGDELTVGKDGKTLYAFRRKQVTVSYNTDGGSAVTSATGYAYTNINKDEKKFEINTLPTTTKDEYNFDGWYKEAGLTNKVTTVSTSLDMTLYAKWSQNTAKITYSYNTDNYSNVTISASSKNIKFNEDAITNAPTATKEGWTFVGWNTDKNATTALSELKVAEAKTLYAIFKKDVTPIYAVTASDNVKLSTTVYIYKESGTVKVNVAALNTNYDSSYTGYATYSYSGKSNLSMDNLYNPGDELTVGKDGKTLYAFRRKQVTVSYNTDGGSAVTSSTGYAYMDINKNIKNYEISSLPTTTKTGYTFEGWYKEAGLTNKVTTVSTNANMTLYAKWTKNTVKVTYTYNANNYSDVTISVASKNIGYNEDAIANAPTASKEGWTFVGWNTDKNATTALSELKVTEAKTLYAIFKKDVTPLYAMTASNKIKLGDTVYIYKESETVKVDVEALDKSYDTNYNGYATYSYSGKSDLSMDNLYNPGDELTVGKDGKTLYAFRRKQVTVSYNTDGGSAVTSSTGYAYTNIRKDVKNYEISSLPTTTKEGYTFGGWYKEAGLTNKVTTVSTSSNMTLYAKWTQKVVEINSSYFDSFSLGVGDTISSLPIVEQDNKAFAGWYNGNTMVDKDYVIPDTSSITLEPHYTTTDVTASVIRLEGDNTELIMLATGMPLDKDFYKYNDDTISVVYEVKKQDTSTKPWEIEYKTSVTEVTIKNSFKLFEPTSMYMWFGSSSESSKLATINGIANINTSKVNSMTGLFQNAKLTTIDLSSWNTSTNTSMSQMFQKCSSLTSVNFGNINTTKVTQMSQMFEGCSSLASVDLSKFNTSLVTYMSSMFSGCTNLSSIDLQNFDLTKLQNASGMFLNCSNIETILFGEVSSPALTDIHSMFQSCSKLTTVKIDDFDTNLVTNMSTLFFGCTSLETINVSDWNVAKVTTMNNMFQGTKITNIDLSKWVTSSLTNIDSMFNQCYNLKTVNLMNFDVTHLQSAMNLFNSCTKLETIYATDWTDDVTISAENSAKMFEGCGLLKGFDSTQVTFTKANSDGYFTSKTVLGNFNKLMGNQIFYDSLSIISFEKGTTYDVGPENMYDVSKNQDLSAILYVVENDDKLEGHISSSVDMYLPEDTTYYIGDVGYGYFEHLTSVESFNFDNLKFDDTTSLKWFFRDCANLKEVDLTEVNLNKVTVVSAIAQRCSELTSIEFNSLPVLAEVDYAFHSCEKIESLDLSMWNVYNVSNLYSLFDGCASLSSLNITGWNFNKIYYLTYTFQNCQSLTSLNLNTWNTEKCTSFNNTFNKCYNLVTLNISDWDVSSGVDFKYMFCDCKKLTGLDLSGWETGAIVDYGIIFAFNNCPLITELDLSGFNISNAISLQNVFNECKNLVSLDLDITRWDLSNITNMSYAFAYCEKLSSLDVSKWKVGNVTNFDHTFNSCKALTALDVTNWDVSKVTNFNSTFELCLSLKELNTSKWRNNVVTSMNATFKNCVQLKYLELSGIDTSNVTDMSTLFCTCENIQYIDITGWDTSKVTNMNFIFERCYELRTIYASDTFVVNISYVAAPFDFDANLIGENGSTPACSGTGPGATCSNIGKEFARMDTNSNSGYFSTKIKALNNLDDYKDELIGIEYIEFTESALGNGYTLVSNFDNFNSGDSKLYTKDTTAYITVDKVNKLPVLSDNYFSGLSNVKEIRNLNLLDSSKTVDMEAMFSDCSSLKTLDLTGWDTSNVKNMSEMFYGCNYVEEIKGIENIDVSKVTTLRRTFENCYKLKELNLSNWTNNVIETFYCTFKHCESIEYLDLSGFDTSNMFEMNDLVCTCVKLKVLDLTGWDTSNVNVNMGYTFERCYVLETIYASDTFVVSGNARTEVMFDYAKELRGELGSHPNCSFDYDYAVTDSTKSSDYARIDQAGSPGYFSRKVNKITDMNLYRQEHLYLTGSTYEYMEFTNSVLDNTYTFRDNIDELHQGSIKLYTKGNTIYISSADRIVLPKNTFAFFANYSNIKEFKNLNLLDTSRVEQMNSVFLDCNALEKIDVSSWDTRNVTSLHGTFENCSSLTSIDLTGWNTSKVQYFTDLFLNCSSLVNINLVDFDTSSSYNMYAMFKGCTSLVELNLSSFDVSNTNVFESMFEGDTALTSIYTDEDWEPPVQYLNGENMFKGCTSLVGAISYDSTKTGVEYATLDGYFTKNVNELKDLYTYFTKVPDSIMTNITKIRFEKGTKYPGASYYDMSKNNDKSIKMYIQDDVAIISSRSDIEFQEKPKNFFRELANLEVIENLEIVGTSKVTRLNYFFAECPKLTTVNLSNFDTHLVKNMERLFNNDASLTSLDLRSFDTSLVEDMQYMFYGCSKLATLDLSTFTYDNCLSITGMFYGCEKLQSIDATRINTSKMTSLKQVFKHCESITTLDLSGFDVSKVKSFEEMFYDCEMLTSINMTGWVTSSAETFDSMFEKCYLLTTLNLSDWDTSHVTNLYDMFYECSSVTVIDLTGWNTTNVTNMQEMFHSCSKLETIYVGENWTTENVTERGYMFFGCEKLMGGNGTSFDEDHDDIDYAIIDSAGTPGYLTYGTVRVNKMINVYTGIFNPSKNETYSMPNITDVTFGTLSVIAGHETEAIDISEKQNGSILMYMDDTSISIGSNDIIAFPTKADYLFYGMPNLENITFDNITTRYTTNMYKMFEWDESLITLDLSMFDVSHVTDFHGFLEACKQLTSVDLTGWQTNSAVNMSYMFAECYALPSINVTNFNVSKVKHFEGMFNDCTSLTTLDVSNFVTTSATDMSSMFKNCKLLSSLSFTNWDTANVVDFQHMFNGCENLESLDLKAFDVSKAVYMDKIFQNCFKLGNLDISTWVTTEATTMEAMFANCYLLTSIDISSFDLTNTKNMSYMFSACYGLITIDLEGLDFSNVENLKATFYDCIYLTTLDGISNLDLKNAINIEKIFHDCASLETNITIYGNKITSYGNAFTIDEDDKIPSTLIGIKFVDFAADTKADILAQGALYSSVTEIS